MEDGGRSWEFWTLGSVTPEGRHSDSEVGIDLEPESRAGSNPGDSVLLLD